MVAGRTHLGILHMIHASGTRRLDAPGPDPLARRWGGAPSAVLRALKGFVQVGGTPDPGEVGGPFSDALIEVLHVVVDQRRKRSNGHEQRQSLRTFPFSWMPGVDAEDSHGWLARPVFFPCDLS